MTVVRTLVTWFVAGLLCGTGPLVAASTAGIHAPSIEAGTSGASSREVLVTLVDEREDRVPVSDLTSVYRPRGLYGNSTWSERLAADLAEEYGLIRKAQWPITALGVHCIVYEVPETQSVELVLRKLGDDRRVESAQSMKTFHVMADGTRGAPHYSDPYFRVQAGLRAMRIETAHRYATGRNVKIAVIDTGADQTHPELREHVTSPDSFVPSARDTATDIHGTAVSGIIAAAAGNGQGIVGIAPGATVRVMKACRQSQPSVPDAVCTTFTLALALNTAIDERPQILNMSLNGPFDPLLQRLIAKALTEGIIIVASEADTPGPDNEFPASVPGVIPVRTAAESGGASVHRSRSIAAPGTEIITTVPQGGYGFMTGSSFAAAHVSGLIALLLELNPRLNGEQVGSLLRVSAGSAGADAAQASSIDACKAVTRLVHLPGPCASPSGLSAVADLHSAL